MESEKQICISVNYPGPGVGCFKAFKTFSQTWFYLIFTLMLTLVIHITIGWSSSLEKTLMLGKTEGRRRMG